MRILICKAEETGHLCLFILHDNGKLEIVDDDGRPHPYGSWTIEGNTLIKHGPAEIEIRWHIVKK